eukprot:scaffold130156_cov19-Prasinocladus_malaysianus.AAC.1
MEPVPEVPEGEDDNENDNESVGNDDVVEPGFSEGADESDDLSSDGSSTGRGGGGLLDALDAELYAPKPPPSQNHSRISNTDVQASGTSFEAATRQ